LRLHELDRMIQDSTSTPSCLMTGPPLLRVPMLALQCALALSVVACGGSGTASVAQVPLPEADQLPPIAHNVPPQIASLLPGQWMELPNTSIRSVLPDPVPKGNPTAITQAWNGGAVDTRRSRLLVWGGGHGDYWGNEVYALDLPTLSIQRVVEPSPRTAEAQCTSALPDGTPVSRHTYDGLSYIAHADRLFSAGGAMAPCGNGEPATWTYDFGASRWTLQVPKSPMQTQLGTMAAYDPVSKKVYVKDQADFYAYTPDTNSYAKLNTVRQVVDYHLSAAIDTRRRKFVMIGDGVRVIDLATNQMTAMVTTNAPSFVTSKQSPGVEYDPVADRIVAWHGGSNVYALDMDTGAWTQVAANAGPTAPAPTQGTFGRWGYVPGYRVFVLVNDIDQNAWVFKLR
jgi:hypothetical protein